MTDPIADFDDPRLFEPWFRGASWDTWRAILKAAFGVPLGGHELELFKSVAKREPPPHRVRELWAIAGRRSGKDSIASFLAAHIAVASDFGHLRPGERATVMCLACDRQQAGIVKNYTQAYFQRVPALQAMVSSETADGVELVNGAEIVVATNSYRAIRGRTIACAIFDETAYWRDENFANPAEEVYAAITPGMISIPDAMLIGISTPYRRSGLLFDTWHRSYGKPDPDVLVVKGPSTTFNPLLRDARQQRIIQKQLDEDPEKAAAEWLAEWRSDLSDLISRPALDAAVAVGRYELPALSNIQYMAYCDPSGGSQDSMALAIVHRDGHGRAILDAIREVRAPFSPSSVVTEFSILLKEYRTHEVVGDRYGGEWPRELFRDLGINYQVSESFTSDNYLQFLPILNSGRCELLDHPRMIGQFLCLERRTAPSGRDMISHPKGTHDDIAVAVAGACVLAAGKPSAMEIWARMGRAA